MIDKYSVEEIRKRDFFSKEDHFLLNKDVKTNMVIEGCMCGNITIVMPIYKHPIEYLERAINSAINQIGNVKYSILIVDNDSDNTNNNESVIRKLNSKLITYYRNEKNLGLFGNWNRCIELAKTEWITFLHSDDMLCENFIDTMYHIISENPAIDQLCCNYKKLDVNNISDYNLKEKVSAVHGKCKIYRVSVEEYFLWMATSVKGALMKKSILIELGGFRNFGDGIGLGDYLTMLKYAYYKNVYLLEENLYIDFFGNNESVNVTYWYPDLISTYFMQIFLIERLGMKYRNFKKYICRKIAVDGMQKYNSGNNWLGVVVPIDTNEFISICNIKNANLSMIDKIIIKLYVRIHNNLLQRNRKIIWIDL